MTTPQPEKYVGVDATTGRNPDGSSQPDPLEAKMTEAAAQAWCTPENEEKEMDSDLAYAFVRLGCEKVRPLLDDAEFVAAQVIQREVNDAVAEALEKAAKCLRDYADENPECDDLLNVDRAGELIRALKP
jgi:hypothetical protein